MGGNKKGESEELPSVPLGVKTLQAPQEVRDPKLGHWTELYWIAIPNYKELWEASLFSYHPEHN